MKLGSLFDGSGGFPLAGSICGIEPVWASEIEPFPIRVTTKRFPNVKHLGSVTDINGAEIEPVDIITFGSPCQDLSVAGKRAGIHDGERSSLFFEAIRIIKEMREHDRAAGRADVDCRPRYIVWENVPGAYSSNGGEDFRCVLEEICKVADAEVSIPRPDKGKWQPAGCIVGANYSVAWRTFDAQYWGVPQRRRRIYLVADFAGERAGEVLFKQDGLRGYYQESGATREDPAADAEGSTGRSGGVVAWTYRGRGGRCNVEAQEELAYCLREPAGGGSQANVVYALQANGIDRAETAECNGCGWREDQCYTLNTIDRHAVAFDCRNHAESQQSGTLQAKPGGGWSQNFINPVCYPDITRTLSARHDSSPCVDRGQNTVVIDRAAYNQGANAQYDPKYSEDGVVPTVIAKGPSAVCYDARGNGNGRGDPTITGDHNNRITDYTALCIGNGQMHNIAMAPVANPLDCMHDQQAVLTAAQPPRKYIVRRLTPVECARLQGFHDWWCAGLETPEPTEEDIAWAAEVWEIWRLITSPNTKPKSRNQLIKWLKNPHSDAAEYKLWGNGIALPCAVRVMQGIVGKEEQE